MLSSFSFAVTSGFPPLNNGPENGIKKKQTIDVELFYFGCIFKDVFKRKESFIKLLWLFSVLNCINNSIYVQFFNLASYFTCPQGGYCGLVSLLSVLGRSRDIQ